MNERLQAVIIGGGQAGLATAHELKRRHLGDMVVLERDERLGDQWRRRWDSLRLFTPARHDALPGSTFPAAPQSFPSKDQMADYLGDYARDNSLPVRTGVRVLSLKRTGEAYLIETTSGSLEAGHVVVATGYDRPKVPPFAAEIDPAIRQLHASEYRNPSQLAGDVLVVGAGTSGVEIAVEAAEAGHRTTLAGRSTGAVPPIFYAFGGRVFWFYANHVTSVRTPIGRRMKPLVLTHGAPLIRLKMTDATAAGVQRAGRIEAVRDGVPVFEGEQRTRPETIVWCTGFTRDYSWIEMPIVGPDGYPHHHSGVVDGQPGLYFVGLPYQTRLGSGLVGGVGRDAIAVADVIAGRLDLGRRPAPAVLAASESAATG
jgi:putative flavoprotein involved in K+ transport